MRESGEVMPPETEEALRPQGHIPELGFVVNTKRELVFLVVKYKMRACLFCCCSIQSASLSFFFVVDTKCELISFVVKYKMRTCLFCCQYKTQACLFCYQYKMRACLLLFSIQNASLSFLLSKQSASSTSHAMDELSFWPVTYRLLCLWCVLALPL